MVLCKCNNCEGISIDTNPQINSIEIDLGKTARWYDELENHCCPICKCDDYLIDLDSLSIAKELWERLSDIAIDENDCIDEPFLFFEAGTENTEIWHWFEEKFNISIAKDLMFLD